MKQVFIYIIIASSMVIASCDSKQKQSDEIQTMAAGLDSVMRIAEVLSPEQRVQAAELVTKYETYAEQYPEDSISPVYLLKASFVAGAIPNPKEQLELLDKVVNDYPKTEYAPQALALAAKASADMNDLSKAREYLTRLQKDYPESSYAVNIDLQIEHVGDDNALFDATMQRKAEMDSINAVKKGTGQ